MLGTILVTLCLGVVPIDNSNYWKGVASVIAVEQYQLPSEAHSKPIGPITPVIPPKPDSGSIKPEISKIKLEDVKNYQQAVQYATEHQGTLLVVCQNDSCAWCHKLKLETLESDAVSNFLYSNKVCIIYYLNTDKEKSILETLGLKTDTALPTYTFVINGVPGKIGTGYKTIDEFIKWAKNPEIYEAQPLKSLTCPNGCFRRRLR
jgi:hypothetical protein